LWSGETAYNRKDQTRHYCTFSVKEIPEYVDRIIYSILGDSIWNGKIRTPLRIRTA